MSKMNMGSVDAARKGLERTSGNIAGKNVLGAKTANTRAVWNAIAGSSKGYITTVTQNNLTSQGSIEHTGIASNIALEGNGMMMVRNAQGEIRYTRDGSFSVDSKGNWTNAAGVNLLASELDEDNITPTSTEMSDLKAVNLLNKKSDAQETTEFKIAMNLNSEQDIIRGAGPTYKINNFYSHTTRQRQNDIENLIIPDLDKTSLSVGDKFTFSTNQAAASEVEFGGIVSSKEINNQNNVFGADKIETRFNFGNEDNQIRENSTFTVTVNGKQHQFVADSASTDGNKFNSVKTLLQKLNGLSDLQVFEKENSFVIGPKNPNHSISFEDTQGERGLVHQLQLNNIAANPNGNRFNSIKTLNQAINKNSENTNVQSTIVNGEIQISATSAELELSSNISTHEYKTISKVSTVGAENNIIENQKFVYATGHGLRAGDVVAVTGNGEEQGDSYYKVVFASVEGFVVANSAALREDSLENRGWKKVAGMAAAAGGGVENVNQDPADANACGDNRKIFSAEANGAPASHITFHCAQASSYQIGDYISFGGGGEGEIVLGQNGQDPVNLQRGRKYKVVGTQENSLIFDVPEITNQAGVNINGAGGISDLYVQNDNLARKFFGANQRTEENSANGSKIYEKSYDSDNAEKTIASGAFKGAQTFSDSMEMFDSLGEKVSLKMHFAKVSDNKWAIEISSPADENGIYTIPGAQNRDDGIMYSGFVHFDNMGHFDHIEGIPGNISIPRNNGAKDLNVDLKFDEDGFTQFAMHNNVESKEQNGRKAGNITGWEVDQEGFIVGKFDNGDSKNLYKIPVATFANMNGLVADANNTYNISSDSGKTQLKYAGIGGAGVYSGETVEGSTVDETQEIIAANEFVFQYQTNLRMMQKGNDLLRSTLDELR
ncbi:MAG TPA: flagellar hook-basal body complex protein [Candidatus Megaira endosymbiont of Hartmannula sinica]|nr:flagellar hook-basal body complex protein [Candidatus Megaera endosymbiont of Hartmannula sinica]